MNRFKLALIICNLTISGTFGQNKFQKIYTGDYDVECFGAYQVTDGGYIITGIAQVNATTFKAFMTRTDCHGEILWSKAYNTSSTIGNISQRVIETQDHGFLLAASIGSYGAYNILLVRTNANGDALWRKIMQGPGDDLVNSAVETSSQEFIIAGTTSSYGQDIGSFYRDVYMMKVDAEGNFLWGKTFGTAGTYDEAFDVIETFDGNYAVTGRYIVSEAFHCFLLKTDTAGNMVYMKAFGDTLHNVTGYGIANTLDGSYIITGSSTLTKESFLDYPDEFFIKTNSDGDTLWCKSYHGNNIDGSENGSSVVVLNDGTYAMGVATFSYPTSGFVPNKHCVLKTDESGNLEWLKAYNNGGSHYPYLTAAKGEKGYVLSGFTNKYVPHFSPMIIKMDSDFQSGCYEIDYTSLTFQEHMPAKVKTPNVLFGSGGSLISTTLEEEFVLNDTTLCSQVSDSCFVFTATNEASHSADVSIRVFPNPASDYVTLEYFSVHPENILVELYNSSGIRMLRFTNSVGIGISRMDLLVRQLHPSIYFMKVNSSSGLHELKLEIAR